MLHQMNHFAWNHMELCMDAKENNGKHEKARNWDVTRGQGTGSELGGYSHSRRGVGQCDPLSGVMLLSL
jgi:hypothetical protein